jgi:DNA-binding response OmpR family regulator
MNGADMVDTATPAGQIRVRELTIDRERFSVTVGGLPVRLTYREFIALASIAGADGRVVTYEALADALWDGPPSGNEKRRINVIVCRMRSRLGEAARYIDTVRPLGYRLTLFATSGAVSAVFSNLTENGPI